MEQHCQWPGACSFYVPCSSCGHMTAQVSLAHLQVAMTSGRELRLAQAIRTSLQSLVIESLRKNVSLDDLYGTCLRLRLAVAATTYSTNCR